MSDTIIRVENLGKKYIIGHQRQQGYTALRDVITNNVKSAFHKAKELVAGKTSIENGQHEEFWALQNVSFDIKQGDRVGIIGSNGAGKSTLLKILSRITEPSKGRITINGRASSLLEVGTGFHPELSGRENIYLNGAILGMSRAEIRRKFDEIVDFAEIEFFLDTPVKRYSSGMYVRLAFAVAAHLESEILIVDEVLAVGDAEFQRKCMGKMGEISKGEGRTVMFVSHNLNAIENLCPQCILMNKGQLQFFGDVNTCLSEYSKVHNLNSSISIENRTDRTGNGKVKVKKFYVRDSTGTPTTSLKSGSTIEFVIEIVNNSFPEIFRSVVASIALVDNKNQIVFLVRTNFTNENLNIEGTSGTINCKIEDFAITNGNYTVVLYIGYGETEIYDLIENVAELTVNGGDYFGTGSPGIPALCKVLTRAKWTINEKND